MTPDTLGQPTAHGLRLMRWTLLTIPVAMLAGTASAGFLFALDWAGATREAHPWLVLLLPLAGFAVAWVYLRWGATVEAGNRLLFDEIRRPGSVVPMRMAPLILFSTVISHLFGASVGREGTAVQMGGSLADQLARPLRLLPGERPTLLMTGVAAGFASVFGTPLAGALFAMEVRAGGRLRMAALYPCVLGAVLADQVGLWWGVQHAHYPVEALAPRWLWSLPAMLLAGAVFGLTARAFTTLSHALSAWMRLRIAWAPLRALVGGAVIAVLAVSLPLERYLGLGLPTLAAAFTQPLPGYDFAAKMALTLASLASGFKGGEVTPLFFIGATLGNALAALLALPITLLAGVGFVAVFAAAARTPIACTVMAFELFGALVGVHAGIACTLACLMAGRDGLYGTDQPTAPDAARPVDRSGASRHP